MDFHLIFSKFPINLQWNEWGGRLKPTVKSPNNQPLAISPLITYFACLGIQIVKKTTMNIPISNFKHASTITAITLSEL